VRHIVNDPTPLREILNNLIRLNSRNEFGTQVSFEVPQEGRESIGVNLG